MRVSEVAVCVQRYINHRVLGKFAAVVPSERMHTRLERLQRSENGAAGWIGFTVGHSAHSQQTGFALDQRNDARAPFADDGVAFPITGALSGFHDGWTFVDALPAKTLTIPGLSTAIAPLLAPSPSALPEISATLAILSNMLIDALDTDIDRSASNNLLGAPFLTQVILDDPPF